MKAGGFGFPHRRGSAWFGIYRVRLMDSMNLPQDFVDLLAEFERTNVRVLVIGGYAVGVHGRPRATKDLDLLVEPQSEEVRERACAALDAFGAPARVVEDLRHADASQVVWFGAPPLRVDLFLSMGNLDFDQAWRQRFDVRSGNIVVHVLGLQDLLAVKRSAARPQDIADIRVLTRLNPQRK
jgi:hypothetical protein